MKDDSEPKTESKPMTLSPIRVSICIVVVVALLVLSLAGESTNPLNPLWEFNDKFCDFFTGLIH